MAKKIVAVVKIQLEAGGATPAPPVGTALGPHGIQTMEFCKQYNSATESMRGTVIPVDITIYDDRSFSFVLKTTPTPVWPRARTWPAARSSPPSPTSRSKRSPRPS
jgi:large subunit ribosomal protein L11